MRPPSQAASELLGSGTVVRVLQSGSMRPFMRTGDAIEFRKSLRWPRIGEVWVIRGENGRETAHRVVFALQQRVLPKGDANLLPDGWIPRSKLFGPVTSIQRNGVWRPANRRRDRALGLAISFSMSAYLGTRRCGGRVLRRLGLLKSRR